MNSIDPRYNRMVEAGKRFHKAVIDPPKTWAEFEKECHDFAAVLTEAQQPLESLAGMDKSGWKVSEDMLRCAAMQFVHTDQQEKAMIYSDACRQIADSLKEKE